MELLKLIKKTMLKYKIGDKVRILNDWEETTIESYNTIWHKEGYKLKERSAIYFDNELEPVEQYTRGNKVLVRDSNDEWEEAIYLTTIEWAKFPYQVVSEFEEEEFNKWEEFNTYKFEQIKPLEEKEEQKVTIELTKEQVEQVKKQFNI